MQAQIREWGNSQGIRLPKEILKSAGMALNEIIDITVSEGVITIKKNFSHKTLEERAAQGAGVTVGMNPFNLSNTLFCPSTSFSYVLLRLKGFIPTVTPAPCAARSSKVLCEKFFLMVITPSETVISMISFRAIPALFKISFGSLIP